VILLWKNFEYKPLFIVKIDNITVISTGGSDGKEA
jgi:hypothetical protein